MSDEQKQREAEVFGQEVSVGDLDAFSGGYMGYHEADLNDCVQQHKRHIYGGKGFPNCAATVESGSHCMDNDACFSGSVVYKGITSVHGCRKAHE